MTVPLLKHAQNFPSLCTAVISTLWRQLYGQSSNPFYRWGAQREADFFKFSHLVLGYANLSPSVVYTSLNFVKSYLCSLQQPPIYGSERTIFLIALMLAYKIIEDYGPMNSAAWSRASSIPTKALVKMEIEFLHQIKHALHMDHSFFVHWVNECNRVHDHVISMSFAGTNDAHHHRGSTTRAHQYYSHSWFVARDPRPPAPAYNAHPYKHARRECSGHPHTVVSQVDGQPHRTCYRMFPSETKATRYSMCTPRRHSTQPYPYY